MVRNTFYRFKLSAMNTITQDKKRSALGLMLILASASALFVARAYSGSESERRNPVPEIVLPSAPSSPTPHGESREPARGVRFNLYDVAIYPREVHVDKGLITISIEDYSGGSPGLIVERETPSAPERAGQVARRGPHWRGKTEMRLVPGRYIVYMADRPANRALLVVEP